MTSCHFHRSVPAEQAWRREGRFGAVATVAAASRGRLARRGARADAVVAAVLCARQSAERGGALLQPGAAAEGTWFVDNICFESPATYARTTSVDILSVQAELDLFIELFRGCDFAGTSEIDLSSPLNYGTPSSRLGGGTPRTPGAVGTPIRPRADVRSERKMRTVNLGGGGGGGSEPVCLRVHSVLQETLF